MDGVGSGWVAYGKRPVTGCQCMGGCGWVTMAGCLWLGACDRVSVVGVTGWAPKARNL